MYATIEQHECLNCRRCLPYANWNVKIDRSYNSIQFTPLFMANKQSTADIRCPHHSLIFTFFFYLLYIYIHTAGSFLLIPTCTNNFIYTKKKKKSNLESASIRWFHFLMKGAIKKRPREREKKDVYFNEMYLLKWYISWDKKKCRDLQGYLFWPCIHCHPR